MEAIRSSDDVILGGRRDAFIGYVFYNYKDLRSQSRRFYADLYWRWTHYHTKQQKPIPMIADIMLNHLTLLESHIKEYIPRIPIARNIMHHELQCNDKLTTLLTYLETSDLARRMMPRRNNSTDLACTNIVLECLSHPQRQLLLYAEHIERLQQVTSPAHPDYALLDLCAQTVSRIEHESMDAMKETVERVSVLWLHDSLVCKEPGEFYDLQLTNPERRILWESKLLPSASSTGTSSRRPIHIYILDHVVLITKCGIGDNATLHQICGQPIPLPMLQVLDSTPTRRHGLFRIHNHHNNHTSTLTFVHTARGEEWSFACEKHVKDRCLQAVHDAQKIWKRKRHPIHLRSIDKSSFRISQPEDTNGGYDKVHCTVPVGKLSHDMALVVADS